MAGQVWQTDSLGGYMFAENLSEKLRTALQPAVRFRQFADAQEAFGLGKGDNFSWNVYSDVVTSGGALVEQNAMPETNFTISQSTLTVTEYGNSVPYTGKLDDLSEQPVTEIIHKVLKNDARKALDTAVWSQFQLTPLCVQPTSGTNTSTITVTTTGTFGSATNADMNQNHVRAIADEMAERNIPPYDGENYFCIARPTTLRALKNYLEGVHQYTDQGWRVIMNGEKGSYNGIRFVEQTVIADRGWAGTGDQAFFFGADTVCEAVSIPEEIRGKIATDYGRDRGIAWYALLGYGLVHTSAPNARILEWGSTG